MSKKQWFRQLAIPIAFVLIGCYLLGLRLYQNHPETVQAPPAAVVYQAAEQEVKDRDAADETEKIHLNTATEEELMRLTQIGEVLAKRIVEKREELGGFSVVEELLEVRGIGEKLFDRIKDDITL